MQEAFHRFLSLIEFKKEYQLKSSGLNYTQLHVLEEIYKNEGIKTLDISKRLNISPSTLIGVLDDLGSRGLIKRERQQTDKRVVIVTATAEGRKKVELHIREDELFLKNLLAPFSEDERGQFFELLKKMANSIHNTKELFNE